MAQDAYRFVRELGVGAFGSVQLVEDAAGQRYARKFLKIHAVRPAAEQIARFKAEFAILTTLQHPHIARIHEFGIDPATGDYFFTGEFVDGMPIHQATQQASIEQIEEWIVQTLRALEFLHAHSVYHFDLKPPNLLVTRDGHIKVIDFGLANLSGRALAGTPSYMAPEICLREARDGRADLYALGVIWYQCLTGMNPFRAGSLQATIDRQLQHLPAPLRSLRPDAPEYCQSIIARLLAKNPLQRYARGGLVIRDINYRGGKTYRIETETTRQGYLPEVGTLIGRETQWAAACEALNTPREATPPFPVLVIHGAAGTGKTRVCHELRYHAQLQERRIAIYDFDHPIDAHTMGELRALGLHGCAADSAGFHRCAPLETTPDLLVIALYPDDAKRLVTWLPEDRITQIALPLFGAQEIDAYLQHVTGLAQIPPELIQSILHRTEGNPRLVRELLAAALSSGTLLDETGRWSAATFTDLAHRIIALPLPTAFDAWFATRWATLTPDLHAIVTCVALCQQPITTAALMAIAQCSAEHLATLDHEGWIQRIGNVVSLGNPGLRAWIRATLPAPERMAWHDRLASHLALLPQEEALYHRTYGSLGPTMESALHAYVAQRAQREEWREATSALAWAWQQLPPGSQRMAIGIQWLDSVIETGEACAFHAAHALVQAAVNALPDALRGAQQHAVQFKELEWHLQQQNLDAASDRITQLLAAPEYVSPVDRLRLQNYRGRIAWEHGDSATAERILRTTWQEALTRTPREQAQVTNNDLSLVLMGQGKFAEAIQHLQDEFARPAIANDPFLAARTLYALCEASLQSGALDTAADYGVRAYELAQPLGRDALLLRILNSLGNIANARAATADALAYYQRGLHLAERLGDRSCTAALSTNIGVMLHQLGKIEESISHLQHTVHLLGAIDRSPADDACLSICREALHNAQHPPSPAMKENPMITPPTSLTHEGWKQLFAITQQLARETDIPRLLEQILVHATTLAKAELGMILLLDAHDALTVTSALNVEPDEALRATSTTIAKQAIQQNRPIIIEDAVEDTQFREEASVMLGQLRSICVLPIHAVGRVIGCMYLSHQHQANAFQMIDHELLMAFADQAGIAIHRANLLERTMAKAQQLAEHLADRESEVSKLEAQLASHDQPGHFRLNDLQSVNPLMGKLFALVTKILPTDLSVFLHGETGTGKEVVARILHTQHPARGKGAFIAVCCGAIPKELMESELFGYKAGAFTGATRDKAGLFEAASGGTLFLDEVAELPLDLQAKLLRVLQEQEIRRLGETTTRKVNCRILSASHRDLRQMVQQGTFREDLFFRLCQIQIDIPPLRQRLEDLPTLMETFIARYCAHHHIKTIPHVAREAMKRFLAYNWPGNIRELENLVQAMCALSDGKTLRCEDIPPHHPMAQPQPGVAMGTAPNPSAATGAMPPALMATATSTIPIDRHNMYDSQKSWPAYELLIIAKAYRHYHGDANVAAKALGISRAKIYKLIKAEDWKNPHHPIHQEAFVYTEGMSLRDYTVKIFTAALLAAGNKPYSAIRALSVSPGYFYKMKGNSLPIPPPSQ